MSRFRLAVVERLRGQVLTERAQVLHGITLELQAMTDERNRLADRLAESTRPGTITSGADLELAMAYREVLRQEIFDLDQRVAERQDELTAARNAWLKARGELRAVQALHERHRAAVRREQARLEQRELDDLAGRHGHVPTAADHLDEVTVR